MRTPRKRPRGPVRPALLPVVAVAVGLVAPLAGGCRINKLVADNMASSLADMQTAFNREESPRQAREAAPALLAMLDGFIAASPENPELLLAGAEMNAQAAFAIMEADLEDIDAGNPWARATYKKALRYALAALRAEDEDLHRVLVAGDEGSVRRALAEVEADDDAVPALFWTGFAWGGYINMTKDDTDVVAELPKVVALMERMVAVAPDFYLAGPHLFMAVYYARGRAIGGDLDKARMHFGEVFRRTKNRLLIPHVLFADRYCVALGAEEPAKARELFQRALNFVLGAPDDLWPEQRLANEISKEWAAELLPMLDDLIFPPLPDE